MPANALKPRIKIAEAKRNGALFQLYQHDDKFGISLDGKELMNSNATASEYLLGKIGVEKIIKTNPARVLIGGLGLGFTLKSVLENTSNLVHVIVAEIIPEIIDWNRSYLTQLNGFLLNQLSLTVTLHSLSSTDLTLTPDQYADGNLKNKKVL